jgi:hypothetical protein
MLHRHGLLASAAAAGLLSLPSLAHAQVPVVDGTRDAVYGTPFAVQSVNTGFGDNQSELDAGYARIQNGKLYLMFSGNLESNFNKFVIFFDTRAGGQNVMRGDNPNVDFDALNSKYTGMTFDSGFSPDYALWYTRNTTDVFVNFSELNTNGGGLGGFLGQIQTPNPGQQGSGTVGGTNGLPTVEIGYNDSNTAGVTGAAPDAADATAAAAVATGSEVAIDLSQLGALENFTMMVGINGSSHDFWSNQFLPGLIPPQGNLGGDGLGNFTGTVGLVNFNNIPGNQFLQINYHAPLSNWNNGNGNWSDATKWTGDGVPNAPDARAVLGTAGGAGAKTITLDIPVSLQSLTLDNPGGYTINGAQTLTIGGNPATPAVLVNSGNHTISAPLVLTHTTNFTIAASSQLSVTGAFTSTDQAIVKAGAGLLQVPHVVGSSLNVAEGTVRIPSNGTAAGTSRVNSLTIAGGTTPTAKLDLRNNALVIDYPEPPPPPGPEAEPFDTVRAQIIAGYNGGNWGGNGITRSDGDAAHFAIGYAESSALATVPAIFGTVDTTAVLVRGTRYGDANLDGTVNLSDFNALASNFGTTGKVWTQGDFNYDGTVNLSDFNLLAGNFGLAALGHEPTPQDWSNLAAAVPEPGCISLMSLAGAAPLLSRRRRRIASRG